MAGGAAGRNAEHIYMDIGVGRTAIVVGAVCSIFFRIFQVLLFYDLPALDHTAAAVRAGIFAFLTDGAAAGTVFILLDFGTDNLLSGRRAGGTADPQAFPDP